MVRQKPIHIVMTPVRNEAWVLRAFLETTARWADYIIIADQMSTDGSRDLYKEYQQQWSSIKSGHKCELIVFDNTNPEFNEAERQAMLVAKAREVEKGRDTLLWGLDADEIIAANAFETEDWKKILNSEKGSVFGFKWAEIMPNQKEYRLSPSDDYHYPWLFHDDGKEPHGNYVRKMHSMRIPYPKDEKLLFDVDDFKILHLAYLNANRVESKRRFYQFVDWELNHRDGVSLCRTYTQILYNEFVYPLLMDYVYATGKNGIDLFSLVDTQCTHCYMDEYIVERLSRHSMKELRKLDMWDDVFLKEYNLQDPRKVTDKVVHWYLHKTKSVKTNIVVKAIDKILKKLL